MLVLPVSSSFFRSLAALLLLLAAQQAYALKLEVEVEGLEGEYEQNVLALLGIYQEREDDTITPLRLEALHRRAPEQIVEALAPFGLYRVQVEDSLSRPASVCWKAQAPHPASASTWSCRGGNTRLTGPNAMRWGSRRSSIACPSSRMTLSRWIQRRPGPCTDPAGMNPT
jgi:hypothetical protein